MKGLLLILLLLCNTPFNILIVDSFVILSRNDRTTRSFSTSFAVLLLQAKKSNTFSHEQNEDKDTNDDENEQTQTLVARRSLFAAAGLTLFVGTTLSTRFVCAADATITTPSIRNNNGNSPSSPPPPTIHSYSATTMLQESLSGFVAGAALTVTKTLVKYPLDTITVRLQMPKTTRRKNQLKPQHSNSSTHVALQDNSQEALTATIINATTLFRDPYRGILNPLLWNVPGGAVFFAVKDAIKSSILSSTSIDCPVDTKVLATCLSVFVANIPYWIIRNPSEVVKTKQQAQLENSIYTNMTSWQVFRALLDENKEQPEIEDETNQAAMADTNTSNSGSPWATAAASAVTAVAPFYVGYWENIVYAYPADVIKFLVYEYVTKNIIMGRSATPAESAIAGAVSTAVAQFITTPLDVVRNRVMTNTTASTTSTASSSRTTITAKRNDKNMIDMLYDVYQTEGYDGLLAGASPRVGKAILSGAIQFATYEETKQTILRIFEIQQ